MKKLILLVCFSSILSTAFSQDRFTVISKAKIDWVTSVGGQTIIPDGLLSAKLRGKLKMTEASFSTVLTK